MTEKPRPFKYWEAPLAPPLHKPFKATVRVPGSKSITNRALVLAAIAENPTTITKQSQILTPPLMPQFLWSQLGSPAAQWTVAWQGP